MRWLILSLLLVLGVLQYRLWIAQGSLAERQRLQEQSTKQAEINRQLRARNAVLEREVLELQSGNKALEQRAREQLGLVREGETYYQYVQEAPVPTGAAALKLSNDEANTSAVEAADTEAADTEAADTEAADTEAADTSAPQ